MENNLKYSDEKHLNSRQILLFEQNEKPFLFERKKNWISNWENVIFIRFDTCERSSSTDSLRPLYCLNCCFIRLCRLNTLPENC